MAKRRGNNEGTIYKLPNGRWRVQITLEGRRVSKVTNTQREAQEWIREMRGLIDTGMTHSSTKITLSDYLDDWLSSTKSTKKPSTWKHYKQVTSSYIIPDLGNVKMIALRPEQIQMLYNRLLDQGVGIYTIQKVHTVLHSALQQAVKMGMIGRNPCSFIQPPKAPIKEMAILNDSQVSYLLVAVNGHRWEALFQLALVTGMRQMELLGLKWSDLDWIRQTIKVERQLVRPNGDGFQFSSPKTRLGRRSIALGDKTIDVLRTHYEHQQEIRVQCCDKWQEHDLIFTTNNGTPIHPRNLLRDFKKNYVMQVYRLLGSMI